MNGMFKTDSSAKVEAPALVIQRSDFINIFQNLVQMKKLNNQYHSFDNNLLKLEYFFH